MTVAVAYDDTQGHPTVTWGERTLRNPISRDPVNIDKSISIWRIANIRNTSTRDITITWPANIAARAAICTVVEGANKIDQDAGNNQAAATTLGTTNPCAPMTETNNFVLGYFVTEGPETNDTVSNPEIDLNGVWTPATLGQRAGTNGAPPVSNVTITEVYHQIVDGCAGTEMRLTNSTAREWVNIIIALETLSLYQIYYAAGKCITCGDVIWCTDDVVPVICSCNSGSVFPDGTLTGDAILPTDQELEDAIRADITDNTFDKIELVKM